MLSALLIAAVTAFHPVPATNLPPCEADDGSGPASCYWNAQQMGDLEGTSFIKINNLYYYLDGTVTR